MIIDNLKAMKKKYQKAGKKKYKGEIKTLSKAIKLIEQLKNEVRYYEEQKQESLFSEIDGV